MKSDDPGRTRKGEQRFGDRNARSMNGLGAFSRTNRISLGRKML
jgi:hypothetical protein